MAMAGLGGRALRPNAVQPKEMVGTVLRPAAAVAEEVFEQYAAPARGAVVSLSTAVGSIFSGDTWAVVSGVCRLAFGAATATGGAGGL